MSRYTGFTVVLQKDIRAEDAKPLMKAIAMLKGVVEVIPIESEFSPVAVRTKLALWEQVNQVFKEFEPE